ncbi:MAG: type II secretion system GspH family protein [Heliobacteriaceae bacterium]|jgi:prepilin-type N-terminal cleavage/methylation domain-containing protein|nr:type II secretion system GspH family protein [Heliobacteriaceae bacterium]
MKRGFTLAEVLITLGIIGVVAALVMPNLIQKQNERATVARVKKIYSVISNATALWQAENGCETNISDCLTQYSGLDCRNGFSGIEKHLNVVEKRYQNQSIANTYWLPETSRGLDGQTADRAWYGVNRVALDSGLICNYMLNDGTTMMVSLPEDWKNNGFMLFDINGSKKPNRVGVDVFPLGFGTYDESIKGVHPHFAEDGGTQPGGLCNINKSDCNPDDGKSPTAYVLAHDKLPDLVKMGYPKN